MHPEQCDKESFVGNQDHAAASGSVEKKIKWLFDALTPKMQNNIDLSKQFLPRGRFFMLCVHHVVSFHGGAK